MAPAPARQVNAADGDTPQVRYLGCGSINCLREITTRLKARRIAVISGKQSYESSGGAAALNHLLSGLDVTRFCDFEPNPRIDDVLRGIELLQRVVPELIIAVGGGSVIDMAKVLAALLPQPGDDYPTMVKRSSLTRKPLPLVAIPTTAGSGSEATHFAVTYMNGKKCSLAHLSILPDYALIDPELTYSQPPYQAACSGMDALCQAVESYWSVNSTKQSRSFASEAIRTILNVIEDAVPGNSRTARQHMAYGAHYAGRAINISKTTAPHALSYTLTSNYSIPHGHAVALLLGKCFLIHEQQRDALVDHRGSAFFSDILRTLYGLLGCEDARSCTDAWYHRMNTLGMETDLERFGIRHAKDRDAIVDGVNPERLSNHPVRLTRALLGRLFD